MTDEAVRKKAEQLRWQVDGDVAVILPGPIEPWRMFVPAAQSILALEAERDMRLDQALRARTAECEMRRERDEARKMAVILSFFAPLAEDETETAYAKAHAKAREWAK